MNSMMVSMIVRTVFNTIWQTAMVTIVPATFVRLFIMLCLLVMPMCAQAQFLPLGSQARALAREGNALYHQGKYGGALEQYRHALEEDKTLNQAIFNTGDALYKQGKYDEAADQFRLFTLQKGLNNHLLAQGYHNLGNSLLKQKKLQESVEAYKQALRNNPNDDDTRHNLAYAQMLLQQQNKQQQQNQQQNQQNQQQQEQQNQQQQQQQNQSPASQRPNLSKADAERMLEALNNEEKNIQKKLLRKRAVPRFIEKDW
jgi:tetratricopeptide (TPR) repeat protein